MTKTLQLFLLFLIPLQSYATGQAGDILIWKGDTSVSFSNPLEHRKDINQLRAKFFGAKPPWNTGCWRAYIAEWTITNDELYLTKIYTCDYPNNKKTADLKTIFGNEYVNGKVRASWFTGEILLPKGKQVLYANDYAYYERELVLDFKGGQLINHHDYSYPLAHESTYSKRPDSLLNFIYCNVNWKKIPPLGDKKVRVILSLISGDTDKPESVRIVLAAPEKLFNEEAVRAVGLLPDWDVYYTRGKAIKMAYTIPIIFDEEKRRKYSLRP